MEKKEVEYQKKVQQAIDRCEWLAIELQKLAQELKELLGGIDESNN